MPGTVAAEAGYLLARQGGPAVEGQFLTSPADGTPWPVELTRADHQPAADLVHTYRNLPLGTTDATVIAVCERLGLTEVAGHIDPWVAVGTFGACSF